MALLLWILAVILVVAGIFSIVRGQILWGIVLIIVGLLVGPGGVSIFDTDDDGDGRVSALEVPAPQVEPERAPHPEIARTTSSGGCTANWNTTSATVGFSAGDIVSPWRSCKVYFTCRHIDGSAKHYKSSGWLNDGQGPVFLQCNSPLYYDVSAVSIGLTTSYL